MKHLTALAAIALATPAFAHEVAEGTPVCNEPVLMVVSGTTIDRERMIAYGKAIAESEIYQKLGGYYLNSPRPIAAFEGETDARHSTIIVRFPCLANAEAFWNSRVYQEEILPMRLDPAAGEYVVRVYPEIPVREDMVGKLGDNAYTADFTAHGVEQSED